MIEKIKVESACDDEDRKKVRAGDCWPNHRGDGKMESFENGRSLLECVIAIVESRIRGSQRKQRE